MPLYMYIKPPGAVQFALSEPAYDETSGEFTFRHSKTEILYWLTVLIFIIPVATLFYFLSDFKSTKEILIYFSSLFVIIAGLLYVISAKKMESIKIKDRKVLIYRKYFSAYTVPLSDIKLISYLTEENKFRITFSGGKISFDGTLAGIPYMLHLLEGTTLKDIIDHSIAGYYSQIEFIRNK